MNFRPGQPFVGTSAFAHKGGMHVHGIRKNASSYEHIDPSLVGNERRVLVSELSGKSNIAEKLGEYGLEQDPGLLDQGPRPGPGPRERGLPVRGGGGVVPPPGRDGSRGGTGASSRRLGYRVSVAGHADREPVTEATVKLRVGDVGRAHRQRGGRPGQRPRRRLAEGARAALPAASRRWTWSITRSA